MAGSRFAYVRDYEQTDSILLNTYIICRLDGKGFHKFANRHGFVRPNDIAALQLMNEAAKKVMQAPDFNRSMVGAFGESDEMSFILSRSCDTFNRRASKILSTIVSLFTSSYVRLWPKFFPNSPLDPEDEGPSFDGRLIIYPTSQEVMDYLKWRQADTHINNLYNTTFWALVQQGGRSPKEATQDLSGTVSSQKNEMLFKQFNINYNDINPMFRKGSLLIRSGQTSAAHDGNDAKVDSGSNTAKRKQTVPSQIIVLHDDIIKDIWWEREPGANLLR